MYKYSYMFFFSFRCRVYKNVRCMYMYALLSTNSIHTWQMLVRLWSAQTFTILDVLQWSCMLWWLLILLVQPRVCLRLHVCNYCVLPHIWQMFVRLWSATSVSWRTKKLLSTKYHFNPKTSNFTLLNWKKSLFL